MRTSLPTLKAEAEALAAAAPRLSPRAGEASAAHPGAAGRRRAGTGEDFWQYRNYNAEDGSTRIDWRRSARGDRLFVRETELETARSFLFWIDPSPGFHWRSSPTTSTKADRAAILFMAFASQLARAGERCGALGGPRNPVNGQRAPMRMAEDLWGLEGASAFPKPNKDPATVLIASDFYTPLEDWRSRLTELAGRNRYGALLAIADPAEAEYPFEGRVRFSLPGAKTSRLIGRAENIRSDYLERFNQRRQDLSDIAAELGWRLITHKTNDAPSPVLAQLNALVLEAAN